MNHINTYEIPNRTGILEKEKEGVYKNTLQKIARAIEPYFYIAPAFAVFSIFLFYPFFKTIYLSFYLTDNQGRAKIFVGLKNYIDLFTSTHFRNSLRITFIFALIVISFSIVLGFITTNLSNMEEKMFQPFKIIFSMPMAIASSSAAIIFQRMFHPTIGLINKTFGTNIQWLLDPKWALPVVAFTTVWMMSGTNYIFMSAGLKNVSKSLYESADIDGAGPFQKLVYITIPSLSPVLFFITTMNIIAAFQSFGQINVMTQGGPGDATNVIVYSIYRDAFFNFRFGGAAAQSIVLFVMILVITLIQFKNERRGVFYR
jgi:sn-glycerol 3-phosphate transport system permease protein